LSQATVAATAGASSTSPAGAASGVGANNSMGEAMTEVRNVATCYLCMKEKDLPYSHRLRLFHLSHSISCQIDGSECQIQSEHLFVL
jgi:hypothetical protein